jgi:MFS family permease
MPLLQRFQPQPHVAPHELERGLRYLTYDGIAAQVMGTLTGGPFLVAFALLLGASNLTIGVISALQPLTQLLQIPTIYLVERVGYRKLLVVVALTLSRLFCFVLIALPYWFTEQHRMTVLLVALLGFFGFGTVSGVAWNPWVRDLIPESRLGSYMAERLAVLTGVAALLSLAAAFGVDLFKSEYGELGVYSVYFGIGGLVGLVGVYCITQVPEPTLHHNPNISIMRLMAEPIRDRNFRQLLIFLGSWSFAVNFAAPFFTVYLLKRLQLDMTVVIALAVLSQAVNVLFFRLWGRLAERFSYKSVLVEAGPLFIITFILWPLTSFGNWAFITLPALIFIYALTGISTAGVQLCTGNLAMKLAPRGRATAYLAVNALVSGIAAVIAPILGGLTATFFEGEEIVFALYWRSELAETDVEFVPMTLRGLDFVFLLAFVFGLYALHRLLAIREQGEVDKGTVMPEFQAQVRKAFDNVSSAAGVRELFSFPYSRLIDLFNRRKTKRGADAPRQSNDST